jgi:uncharacterized repeat protein (TIGR02543 family)
MKMRGKAISLFVALALVISLPGFSVSASETGENKVGPAEPQIQTAEAEASFAPLAAANGVNVQAHTQEEIKAYIKANGAKVSDSTGYLTNPSTTNPYAPGSLTQSSLDSALGMINQVRYIAGLDPITLDSAYNEQMQAASLVMAANNTLSHDPAQPAGMDNDLYTLGYSGAGSANIAWGYATLGSAIINGWMEDGDPDNIAAMGHRRWILNPRMGKIGFGKVGAFTAMKSFDTSNAAASQTGVAWPAQNMPIEFFASYYPWTISMGSTVNAAAVTVTLKRQSDNRTWSFSQTNTADGYFNVNNQGYGASGCIVFRPNSITYSEGDVFEVTITGLSSPVSYTVNFFSIVERYTVSFNANGGQIDPASARVIAGQSCGPLPLLTRSGYIFDGWFTLPVGGRPINNKEIVTGDVTFYAQWIKDTAIKDSSSVSAGFQTVIKWMIDKKITSVNPYNPRGAVTREQMAAFMYALAEKPALSPDAQAIDIQDASQMSKGFETSIKWMIDQKITSVNPYNPKGKVTREQMAAFMYSFNRNVHQQL